MTNAVTPIAHDSQSADTFDGVREPFSHRLGEAELERHAQNLARALGLRARVRLVYGDAESGLEGERRFRLAWWTHGIEPLRAALQRAKIGAHERAHAAGTSAQLTDAWKRAEQTVNSDVWRERLRELIAGRGAAEVAYLRAAFRFAQQAWSRAARWEAARAATTARESNPFLSLISLLSAGAWPLGCDDGALWVFVRDESRGRAAEFVPAFVQPDAVAREKYVFVSALFRDAALTENWQARLRANGWQTVHGPVSEHSAPPEVQLGRQIRAANAVVGIVEEVDADFGLPWWMFQELDYARACRRPVYLITERGRDDAIVREHVEPFLLPPDGRTAGDDERAVWSWLEANAPHNGGRDV
ncbi:MAG TPA: hypothetical protein VJT82_01740 [Pyrinomonadaceae bacterium]|nr:hypothetical protein [Pyrinomonadaceae bacterium]